MFGLGDLNYFRVLWLAPFVKLFWSLRLYWCLWFFGCRKPCWLRDLHNNFWLSKRNLIHVDKFHKFILQPFLFALFFNQFFLIFLFSLDFLQFLHNRFKLHNILEILTADNLQNSHGSTCVFLRKLRWKHKLLNFCCAQRYRQHCFLNSLLHNF